MLREIQDTAELGRVIRAVRVAQGVRQEDLAAMVPASHVFIIDVERGKPTAHIGKVLALLHELGIRVTCDVPEEARALLDAVRKPGRASKSRRRG